MPSDLLLPRHDLTLAEMGLPEIRQVVDTWASQVEELGAKYRWVQVFENKGAIMGCSNPHPHGQVWASDKLPSIVEAEDTSQRRYWEESSEPLLIRTLQEELKDGRRLVEETAHWLLTVPFWATWPFEYLLTPKRPVQRFPDLAAEEREDLSLILKKGLLRYDGLFQTSFLTRWAGMALPRTAKTIPTGSFTLTSIHPCFVRRPFASSWWVTRCLARLSGTSPPSKRLSVCGLFP